MKARQFFCLAFLWSLTARPGATARQSKVSCRLRRKAHDKRRRMPKPVSVAPVATAPRTLIQHGHLYTVGPLGTLHDGDVLIEDGKIVAGRSQPHRAGRRQDDQRTREARHARAHGCRGHNSASKKSSWSAETNDTTANQSHRQRRLRCCRRAQSRTSTLIPVARIAGVTRSLTAPAACSEVFCGTAAVIHLGNGPDLLVKPKAGVLVDLEPAGGAKQANSRPDIWAKFPRDAGRRARVLGGSRGLSSPRRRSAISAPSGSISTHWDRSSAARSR